MQAMQPVGQPNLPPVPPNREKALEDLNKKYTGLSIQLSRVDARAANPTASDLLLDRRKTPLEKLQQLRHEADTLINEAKEKLSNAHTEIAQPYTGNIQPTYTKFVQHLKEKSDTYLAKLEAFRDPIRTVFKSEFDRLQSLSEEKKSESVTLVTLLTAASSALGLTPYKAKESDSK